MVQVHDARYHTSPRCAFNMRSKKGEGVMGGGGGGGGEGIMGIGRGGTVKREEGDRGKREGGRGKREGEKGNGEE
jgi:hypothetical protein